METNGNKIIPIWLGDLVPVALKVVFKGIELRLGEPVDRAAADSAAA
jgi:hypothetical protein